MTTAHHLVVVVTRKTAPPHLKVMITDPPEDHRVSEDVIDKEGQELVVAVSDEAFILIYKNFIDKWIAKFHMEQ
jgi:hypothetical protein